MHAPLFHAIRQFLASLEQVQTELLETLAAKREALSRADQAALRTLAGSEAVATQRLQGLLGLRQKLLTLAGQAGLPNGSLAAVVAGTDDLPDRPALEERMARLRETSSQLQQATWADWIIAQRCYTHCTELLEMVAHRGRPSPTYGDAPSRSSSGGAVLDASI